MGIILELKNAQVSFGGIRALDKVSLEIREGEIVALLGPNGAGKSTALKALFGLVKLSRGAVSWRGKKIKPEPRWLVKEGVAFVPQGRRVFTDLSVEENLEVAGLVLKSRFLIQRRIKQLLELFPLLQKSFSVKAGRLSGGQQQLLSIARGLMAEPKVLLLDEPSLGLAPRAVRETFQLLYQINRSQGTALVVVEHNTKSLLGIAERLYVLVQGRLTLAGQTKNLADSERLEQLLLGVTI